MAPDAAEEPLVLADESEPAPRNSTESPASAGQAAGHLTPVPTKEELAQAKAEIADALGTSQSAKGSEEQLEGARRAIEAGQGDAKQCTGGVRTPARGPLAGDQRRRLCLGPEDR